MRPNDGQESFSQEQGGMPLAKAQYNCYQVTRLLLSYKELISSPPNQQATPVSHFPTAQYPTEMETPSSLPWGKVRVSVPPKVSTACGEWKQGAV